MSSLMIHSTVNTSEMETSRRSFNRDALNQNIFDFSLNSAYIDKVFVISLAALISFGLIMVASSSIDFSAEKYNDPWFFTRKQSIFLCLGFAVGAIAYCIPLYIWDKLSSAFLVLGIFFLCLVLVPGIGKVVNGSQRWLSLGPIGIQASEIAKFCLILFFASYLQRRNQLVKGQWLAFSIMVFVIGLTVLLLMLEPDFGSSVVICLTLGAMMFVAGVPIIRFILLSSFGLVSLSSIAVLSPYRWERLVAFMDPWSRQFDSGYQLVQSLIAFGRGEWFGLGLGNSLQKLFFLPEAHTDFIFAIVAEEFGLIGAACLIAVFCVFIAKIFQFSKQALKKEWLFAGYLCLGIGVMLGVQAFINMGVASGLLPTKGLTLPFISYGGSSLVITCLFVALVMRVKLEMSRES